jgi:hypothetical protein
MIHLEPVPRCGARHGAIMSRIHYISAILASAGILAAVGAAFAQQDKYAVKVPNGLAFADFRGYESWQTIAVSQADSLGLIEVIVGDPAMIKAYQEGYPGNGKPWPDGVRMAKIHWKAIKSPDAPAPTTIPGALDDVDFMVKDSKRFADGDGWGYAQFNYNPASDSFSPLGTGAKCGTACHALAKAKDYVFTAYGKR